MRHAKLLGVVSAAVFFSGQINVQAADLGHGDHSRHHVALFIGAGVETKRDGPDESALAMGGVYRCRVNQSWGVGAAVETLSSDTARNFVLAMPFSIYPYGNWRLFAGPGIEFADHGNKALLRVGAGYEFHLKDRWSLSPEIVGDFISGGEQT